MSENKTILICDDDEGILDMLEMVFEDSPYTIIAEQNSLNIKGIIEKQSPDLVVLDLWMPVLSGDQVLKMLRKNPKTEEIPVIIISASREGKQIAANAGATGYISKPFDFEELMTMVNRLIN
ncbi:MULTISPECIES: response regulator [unclassified Pedobacter]|uniref:response regulator n=1 Tax=unclassified Pedobacter TaxID=2628915 RepID=UPI000B4AC88E|nr:MULTISPECIES: response regulator [unclassified Pedobacter]MCX2430134.1 response regulator [Pedobacter sp. GR22-10]MCX2585721.1 response regulator [Pedobacter sp. MR22-3]OWK70440.1 response regulator [Pedobacter sp. AJM]